MADVRLDGDALSIALGEGITYHDAVYLALSPKLKATLVGDDWDLVKRGAVKSGEVSSGGL